MLGVLIVIILFVIAFGGKKPSTMPPPKKGVPCKWCGKYYDTQTYGDYMYCSNSCKHLDKNFSK